MEGRKRGSRLTPFPAVALPGELDNVIMDKERLERENGGLRTRLEETETTLGEQDDQIRELNEQLSELKSAHEEEIGQAKLALEKEKQSVELLVRKVEDRDTTIRHKGEREGERDGWMDGGREAERQIDDGAPLITVNCLPPRTRL